MKTQALYADLTLSPHSEGPGLEYTQTLRSIDML